MWVQILLFTMLKTYKFWKEYKFNDLELIFNKPSQILFFYSLFTTQISKFQKFTPSITNLLITLIFFKKKNINKLYLNNDYLFLTPGIVLKYNNLLKKNLKNKSNMWNLFFIMFTKIKNFTLSWQLHNFFLFNNKIIRLLIKFNLINSWIFLNFFKQKFIKKYKTVRRIKKWIKKKYFKINI